MEIKSFYLVLNLNFEPEPWQMNPKVQICSAYRSQHLLVERLQPLNIGQALSLVWLRNRGYFWASGLNLTPLTGFATQILFTMFIINSTQILHLKFCLKLQLRADCTLDIRYLFINLGHSTLNLHLFKRVSLSGLLTFENTEACSSAFEFFLTTW